MYYMCRMIGILEDRLDQQKLKSVIDKVET
jgi:hypothetical protein